MSFIYFRKQILTNVDDMIWENRIVTLLGVRIDSELKFDDHLTNICIKANTKLTVLTRMRKYLDFGETSA